MQAATLPRHAVTLLAALAFLAGAAASAWAQQGGQGAAAADPFAQSQLSEPIVAGVEEPGATQVTLRGFVDAGYIRIKQSGPSTSGGDLSWAFGNGQFTFFAQNNTFTVNEVDLTLDAQRDRNGLLHGGRISIDYYPSQDLEAYSNASSVKSLDVDQAFVFLEWTRFWKTRVVLGRAPGLVTLEQWETDSPDSRTIGHTYVFQAGGGYPYGLQVITRPGPLAIKLGYSNGGVGAYSFVPGDDSTLNRAVARDHDKTAASDAPDGKTGYGAIEWTAFDRAADLGTLRVAVAGASNSALTYNAVKAKVEPYSFNNAWIDYRIGAFEVRAESAKLETFYESIQSKFDASMSYLLLSWYLGANHLFTLRGEKISFTTDRTPDPQGDATKSGLSYRYRLSDAMVLKLEAVREKQQPQFFVATKGEDLTTDVLATSWVYSF